MMLVMKMQKTSNLFEVHMKKIEKSDGTKIVVCNYCSKEFKWSKSRSYGTYRRYVNNLHPIETARSKLNGQTHIVRYSFLNIQLFRYSDANNREIISLYGCC